MTLLKLGLVQTHLHWEDPEANRQHLEPKLAALAQADLIVLAEMFSTGFSMDSDSHAESMTDKTVTWLQKQSEHLGTAICGSVMIKENGQFYNRFLMFSPDIAPVQYDKRHLFRMADEHKHFTAGDKRVVFELKGVRICPQVCYDLRFPVFSRNLFKNNPTYKMSDNKRTDYDLLLFVANWPAKRQHHWRTLLTARAIENQAFVVGLNRIGSDGNQVDYCGDSGLIHPNGEWLVDLRDQDTASIVELNLSKLSDYRQAFPAWQDADSFTLN
jgi:omega-amidase